jgi:hypothetical protein
VSHTALRLASVCREGKLAVVRQDGRQVRPGLVSRSRMIEELKLQNDEGTAPDKLLISR